MVSAQAYGLLRNSSREIPSRSMTLGLTSIIGSVLDHGVHVEDGRQLIDDPPVPELELTEAFVLPA